MASARLAIILAPPFARRFPLIVVTFPFGLALRATQESLASGDQAIQADYSVDASDGLGQEEAIRGGLSSLHERG
jgi:hypothetical protein